jgi:hypothetical protein
MIDWRHIEVALEYIAAFGLGVGVGTENTWLFSMMGAFLISQVIGRITAWRLQLWRQRSQNSRPSMR